jgi:excisionase family DNA binding protein
VASVGEAEVVLAANHQARTKDEKRMARTSPISRLLTVAEVATMMRVSRMTVYRLIRRGQLNAIRVGRNYRVKEDDLQRYLEAQVVPGGKPRR